MYPDAGPCSMVDVLNYTSGPPVADQSRHRPARIRPPSQRLGYARTTPDQHDLRRAVLELHQLGVPSELVFIDRGSTARGTNRPELQAAIKIANPGDVLVIASLARLARSHHDLTATINTLSARGILLEIGGQRLNHISGQTMVTLTAQLQADLITQIIAEHDRYLIRRRDPRGASPTLQPQLWLQVRELFDAGQPRNHIAALFQVSRATIYRIAGKPMHGTD